MVGHMLRFSPLPIRMKELIGQGTIGEVTYARADFMYDATMSQRQWVKNQGVAGGGPIFDIGVHCLDTLKFILNDEVIGVKAFLSPLPTRTRTEDTASLALQFSRGALGAIYCSYVTSFRRTFIEVVGTTGVLSAYDFTHNNAVVGLSRTTGKNGRKVKTETEEIDIPNGYITQVNAFSSAILKNTQSPIPGEIGLSNQKVLDAAIKGV
jgi:1,5-anhydro-D-fructose reductase (1,5-anhydro-D-mannitol-forming)